VQQFFLLCLRGSAGPARNSTHGGIGYPATVGDRTNDPLAVAWSRLLNAQQVIACDVRLLTSAPGLPSNLQNREEPKQAQRQACPELAGIGRFLNLELGCKAANYLVLTLEAALL
jgi:hypothetical protein